ncbi:hypothetical protein K505DRAFT_414359 [Melanomma pulvis-pyrius CBS 109.77]|uniref:Uncharacterized protein n=1 Tax=Melanomma pulvis-pyrius CBS 109.77 TaxID=1314802 RepID=A0A6A6XS65_9PLEO|nr:hypothetical protein K505DRAFT_414359 [Melanomma pulvis-pyrius CBS 109.77]
MKRAVTDRSSTSPSMKPSACRDNRIPLIGTSSPSSQPGFTPRSTGSHAGGRGFGPSRLRHTESTEMERNSPAMEDRIHRERHVQQSRPSTTPSKLLNKDEKTASEGAAKIKAKRSFRNFFYKRDAKGAVSSPRDSTGKRSSITMTGSTLAKRLRNSANFSKTTLPKDPESKCRPESKPETMSQINNTSTSSITCDVAVPSLNAASSAAPSEVPSATRSEISFVINNIIERVNRSHDTADRLRGLEIAEAVVHTIETVKKAKISSLEAKKHARDAEIHYNTASLELQRIQKLIEPIFDSEIMHDIKKLVHIMGLEPADASVPSV